MGRDRVKWASPTSIIRALGRLPSPQHPRERYECLRQRALALSAAFREYTIDRRVRYGDEPQYWPRTAHERRHRLLDAVGTTETAFFDSLCAISPRGDLWRSGIAAWWIVEHVTYDLAITRDRLPLEPVPGYGASRYQVEAVVRAVDRDKEERC